MPPRAHSRRRQGRSWWTAAGLAFCAVVAVGVVGSSVAASAQQRPGSAAVVDRSDPRAVVGAYLAAIVHDRADEMRGYVSPGATHRFLAHNPLDNGLGRRDAQLAGLVVGPTNTDGFPRDDGAVYVPVTFVLSGVSHETGWEDGPTSWGCWLTRQDPERGWLIVDEGVV